LPQSLILASQALQFGGILIDRALLAIRLSHRLAHQLVADHRTCDQSHWSTDQRDNRGVPDSAADNRAAADTQARADQ
jgi:hypothetical protein